MATVLPLLPERHRPAPKPSLLWTLGIAAVASCALTVVLASANEELYQPALRVLLVWWVTLPYIFAGIVAWRRRPDSFFGPLMILAGFIHQLSICNGQTSHYSTRSVSCATCLSWRSGCTSSSPIPRVGSLGELSAWWLSPRTRWRWDFRWWSSCWEASVINIC
jgi:hypothetical protein